MENLTTRELRDRFEQVCAELQKEEERSAAILAQLKEKGLSHD